MEPGGRKLLPRVQPSVTERDTRDSPEHTRNGSRVSDVQDGIPGAVWRGQSGDEEPGAKRKRLEEQHPPSQALPSLRHLLTAPAGPAHSRSQSQSHSYTLETEKSGHARLIRASKDAYIHEGPYKFLAPYPSRDFPTSVSADSRDLSFAVVEPELMDVFRRTWYLRHYIRLKRLQGEHWLDHIFFNDSYGIENTLYTWTSRYEPGTLQYPASMLYKHCVWLFFNRSIQASQPSPAFTQVVDDALHFLRTLDNALGPTGDRSVFLIPLFILGIAAFYPAQRKDVWEALEQLEHSVSHESINHAVRSLEKIWIMMDDGRIASTWDWERFQAHESTMTNGDRAVIDLLYDPLAPIAAHPSRVRSPDPYEFDPSRFRAIQAQVPPPPALPPDPAPKQPPPETETYTPPHSRSPLRHHSLASAADAAEMMRVDGNINPPEVGSSSSGPAVAAQQHQQQQIEMQQASSSSAGPRPFLAPPPPPANYHHHTPTNSEVIQVLHRKSAKTKSSVPPCPTCGKELKNPSDAQKHQLQHSKPFRCREPGCTRTQGFATENDLQRHRKSVHGASPRIGNKIGYICAACPEPSDGTSRKWWPRLDNFKAHIRRKHQDQDEEVLINASASARRPGDEIYTGDPPYNIPGSIRWPEDRHYDHGFARHGSMQDPPYPLHHHRHHQYDVHDHHHDYGGGEHHEDEGTADDEAGLDRDEKGERSNSQSQGSEREMGTAENSGGSESDVAEAEDEVEEKSFEEQERMGKGEGDAMDVSLTGLKEDVGKVE